jgi:hypothetical protein
MKQEQNGQHSTQQELAKVVGRVHGRPGGLCRLQDGSFYLIHCVAFSVVAPAASCLSLRLHTMMKGSRRGDAAAE